MKEFRDERKRRSPSKGRQPESPSPRPASPKEKQVKKKTQTSKPEKSPAASQQPSIEPVAEADDENYSEEN